jgi:hypothetical protein
MLIFWECDRWWMCCNFLFGFGMKPSGEYIKGVFPLVGTTRPRFRSSNSVAVILRVFRRAIERFFKIYCEGRPLKPTLYLYMIMLLIRTGRLSRYSAKKTAYILYINRDREFVKKESELLNILNFGV